MVIVLSLIPMMVSLARNKSTKSVASPIKIDLQYQDGNSISIGDRVASKERNFRLGTIELLFTADSQFSQKATGRDALVPKSQIHVRTEDGELVVFQSPFNDLIFLNCK